MPKGEAIARVEAPRGEDSYYIKSNGTDKPERVKVRAPTLSNVYAVPDMLKGDTMADVTLVIAAIDPCMSCADRVTVVHEEDNSVEVLTKQDLQKITRKVYGGEKR